MQPSSRQPLACFHCGLPVPANSRYSVEIDKIAQPMCCPGCQAVARMIVDTGLGQYYKHRTELATPPLEIQEELLEKLSFYDRPDIQQDFCYSLDPDHNEAVIIVEGITCAACTWLIERQLKLLDGVLGCSVNLSNHRARISWNTDTLKLSKILATIYQTGYKAHPFHIDKQDEIAEQEQRAFIKRLGIAGIGMMQVMMYAIALYAGAFEDMSLAHRDFIRFISLVITLPVVFYSAQPFFKAAWRSIRSRKLSMDVPVSLAILAAFFASVWSTMTNGQEVYFDSVCMFTFFLLSGRFLEFRARRRMNQSNHVLNRIVPETTTRITNHAHLLVPVRDLQPGDVILVKAGQTVPVDGVILDGQSSVDESHLTGEFDPITKATGDRVIAGSINTENPVTIKVILTGQQTCLSGIMRLLDQAQASKPPIASLADNIAQYFVAFVLIMATVVAVTWWFIAPEQAFWITLSVLVVTCPCALSLATPTALTAATGAMYDNGILVISGHTLEGLAEITHIIFDKTGTLTKGQLSLQQVVTLTRHSRHECHNIAAALEAHSEHPIAQAFPTTTRTAIGVKIKPACGIEGKISGNRYRLGRPDFAMALCRQQSPISNPESGGQGQWLLLTDEEQPLAWFQLNDQLRDDARHTVEQLTAQGFNLELLSGDSSSNTANIAGQLNITTYRGGATPSDKIAHIEALQAHGAKILMIGDGINDAPVLAAADVSIAMTNASDLTKSSADAIMLSGSLASLLTAVTLARKTRRIIGQNVLWALGYNLSALPLAAMGFIPPYLAAIGMSFSSLVVILNALRLTKTNDNNISAKYASSKTSFAAAK